MERAPPHLRQLRGGRCRRRQGQLDGLRPAQARVERGPAYAYTIENLRSRRYPLFDEIYAYCDADKAQLLDPKVREYLRFIVSREGQEAVMRDGKYLPLTAEAAREQLKKLE